MDRTHSHIDLDERRKIARWRMAGLGIEIIAEKLGRHFHLFAYLPHCYGNLNGARFREAMRGAMHRRKEIAERVVARWKAHGFALDADPAPRRTLGRRRHRGTRNAPPLPDSSAQARVRPDISLRSGDGSKSAIDGMQWVPGQVRAQPSHRHQTII